MPLSMTRPAPNKSAVTSPAHSGYWGRARRWTARFGVAGFLFFLVKGLLWLAIPAILAKKALEN